MNGMRAVGMIVMLMFALAGCARNGGAASGGDEARPAERFVGGIVEDRDAAAARIIAVRNNVAQPGEEIVTLRYFKIKKGTFPEVYRLSAEGVWPYFEKIGARIIGMWQVVAPEGANQQLSPDYDEVYMAVRYASFEHWRATRDMAQLGGNGPDWEKCRDALAARRELTIESHVVFLKGQMAPGGPYYMPGVAEIQSAVEKE